MWQSPCSAWLEIGATESCVDGAAVLELFWAPVNSPFFDPTWEGFGGQANPSPWDHFELNDDSREEP